MTNTPNHDKMQPTQTAKRHPQFSCIGTRGCRASVVLAGLLSTSIWAAAPLTRPEGAPAVNRMPEYPTTSRPTEEMLGRESQVIILPSEPMEYGEDRTQRSGGAIGRITPEQRRLPEGYIVASREAKVQKQGDWFTLNLAQAQDLPDAPPLRVLPNQRLAMLETIVAEKTAPPTFFVTGRVTEFQGNNYLLIENLSEPVSVLRPIEPEPATAQKATPPAATTTAPGHEPTAEEVVRRLMDSKPRRAMVLPQQVPVVTTQTAASAPTTGGREAARWAEETQLADRPGRILPGDPWWMLAFENLSTTATEKPIRLLPNRVLETAIALTGGGTRSTVLIVSGETTVYKGNNYLLLRKVLVRRDLGNLR